MRPLIALSRSAGTVAVLVLLAGCGKHEGKEEKKGPGAGGPSPAVVVATIEQKTVPVTGEFIGRTVGLETVELTARVEGFLMEAPFQEGSFVAKGAVLFRIDPRTYEARLQAAKAKLMKAEADLYGARETVQVKTAESKLAQSEAQMNKAKTDVARLEPLAKEEAVPKQDLDDAMARLKVTQADTSASTTLLADSKLSQKVGISLGEAEVAAAKADVVQAELDLSYCVVKSPIDGIVGTKQVDVGNLVGRGQPTLLATVSTVNPFKVTFAVSEADYLKFRKRSGGEGRVGTVPLELVLADNSKFAEKGRVLSAERAVDEKTGTLQLQAQFANPGNLVRPGQFARVQLPVDTIENAVLVPQRAVSDLQSAKVVYVVGEGNKVALRTVQIGPRYESYYVALEGLKAGERIITDGFQKVRPGMTVTPTDKPMSQEPKK